MGRELVRVPPGFAHPTDDDGYFIPGAHYMALHHIDETSCTAYQVYENVSEGSPVSPVFENAAELMSWLEKQGVSRESADAFVRQGFAPSFVLRSDGEIVAGIEGSALGRESKGT